MKRYLFLLMLNKITSGIIKNLWYMHFRSLSPSSGHYGRSSAVVFSVVRKKPRRREDSNPRWPYDHSGFRNRCTQPAMRRLQNSIRWGRDSNSGWTYAHNGFQDRRIRPLCHPTNDLKYEKLLKDNQEYILKYSKGDIAEIDK